MRDGGSDQRPQTDVVAVVLDAVAEALKGQELVDVQHESGGTNDLGIVIST